MCSWLVMGCRVLPFHGNSHLKLFCPVQCKRALVSWVSRRRSQSRVWEQMHRCVCVCVCVESCFSPHDDFLETFPVNDLSNAGDESALELWEFMALSTSDAVWVAFGWVWKNLRQLLKCNVGAALPAVGGNSLISTGAQICRRQGIQSGILMTVLKTVFLLNFFRDLHVSVWPSEPAAAEPREAQFGCSSPLADASGGLGCLLTFLQLTSACCHGGQYVSVNNLAWRSLSALTLQLYWTTQLDWARLDSSRLLGLLEWLLNL